MYDPALGRWHVVDPKAGSEHNLSLTPYHFVNNNPILFIDPNGLDWYKHDETGSLHWYNGAYEYDAIPDGYSYLGGDDFFGEESYNHLQEGLSLYKENTGESLSSMDFSVKESEVLAKYYGFEKVPSKIFSYQEENNYILPNGLGVQTHLEGFDIVEKYTYAPKNYVGDQDVLWDKSLSYYGGFHHSNLEINIYSYRERKLGDYFKPGLVKTAHDIMKAFKDPGPSLGITVNNRKAYSGWSAYPVNGPYYEWRPGGVYRNKIRH